MTVLAFSRDGTRIISGSTDTTLRIWDTRTGVQVVSPLRGHERTIFAAAFSPDGSHIVSGSSDKTACVWDVNSSEHSLTSFLGHAGHCSCSGILS